MFDRRKREAAINEAIENLKVKYFGSVRIHDFYLKRFSKKQLMRMLTAIICKLSEKLK